MKSKMFTAVMLTLLFVVSLLGFTACNSKNGNDDPLTFVVPEGTPALAIAKLYSDNSTINGKTINYSVVSPSNIAKEIGKSDLVIMPVNAGAMKIYQGADYKLVSVAVDGSIFLIGKSNIDKTIVIDELKGSKIACIGQTGVPGLVFRYIMGGNNVKIVDNINDLTNENVYVQYVADGNNAIQLMLAGNVDYIVVGEPAATAVQKGKQMTNGDKFLARMSLQDEYAKISGVKTFPQAGLFVKTSLTKDVDFMNELFLAMASSKEWVISNKSEVTTEMKKLYESANFPAPSIDNCAIDARKLDDNKRNEILEFLKRIQAKDSNKNLIDWDKVELF